MKIIKYILFCLCGFLVSCQQNTEQASNDSNENQGNYAVFSKKEIPFPCKNCGEPNLAISKQGVVYLSFIEAIDSTGHALKFSKWNNGKWENPKEISRGKNWFVNWADFPSFAIYNDNENHFVAHWLVKRTAETYDYDVYISQSKDGGDSWSKPFILHQDNIAAEHGFVSLTPFKNNQMFASWLDGRNTKIGMEESHGHGHDHGHGHGGGPMTLRGVQFDIDGKLSTSTELDVRVCDCCQTAAVATKEGLLVAYRDRSEEEMRDISIVRFANGKWSKPQTPNPDHWKIEGCPVNGPALDAEGNFVGLAWFSAANEQSVVKLSLSDDGGQNFSEAIALQEANPLGRVDVEVWNKEEVIVTWIEDEGEDTFIKIVRVNASGKIGIPQKIIQTKSSRRSGFPRIQKVDNRLVLAWTSVDKNEITTIKTMVIQQ